MAKPGQRKPTDREAVRIAEEAEEGLHGRLDDPDAPLETGAIERGRVDAGPTGEREGGYRQAEPGSRIMTVVAIVLIVIAVGLAWVFFG